MWCYFCDDAKGGTFSPSSVTCIFPLFEHSKGSTFIRLSKRIERIFAFFCLLFYTLYIYTRARALPGCVRLDQALPHHTMHHAHQGSSFWSILDASGFSSSPHENREFVTRWWSGSEFSILRDRVFESTSYASPCENRESVDRGLGGAELVILREDFSGEGKLLIHHLNLSSAIR